MKPVALVADALRDCSWRGDSVLDPFGGSGTTMIAAHRTGRVARLIEIDPLYCDLTVRRRQLLTGKSATLADTGQTFDEVAVWRSKFKSEPPDAFGPDLLRRSIAHKFQEDAYGGLDRATARLLNQLIAQLGKNNSRIVVPRRIKAGAILVREWKGKSHRVTVTETGFAYEGKPYDNLSEIARLITGTRWNGPRFFGLGAARKLQHCSRG